MIPFYHTIISILDSRYCHSDFIILPLSGHRPEAMAFPHHLSKATYPQLSLAKSAMAGYISVIPHVVSTLSVLLTRQRILLLPAAAHQCY